MPPSIKKPSSHASILLCVFIPFALCHFLSYLYRTINAVISPDLVADLAFSATDLGLLTSTYFLTFAIAQLPIGVGLDRYGPRRVQIPLLIVAGIGAFLFANANSLTSIMIARALIGLGVAGCLMSAIKASSLWFPKDRLPFFTGVLLAVGGMGAMASTAPLQSVLHYTNWRGVFIGLSIATISLSGILFFVVPEPSSRATVVSNIRLIDQIKQIGQIYGNREFWRLVLFSVLPHATYMSVQGLWMGPWLRDVAQLDRQTVSQILFAGTLAMIAGSLSFGWLSEKATKWGYKPILVCGIGVLVFVLVQLMMILEFTHLAMPIAILFGFTGTAATLNYAIVAQSLPSNLTGRASTSLNLVIFLVAFAVQWALGGVINQWTPDSGGHYPREAYHFALLINVLLQIPGLILWLTFRPLQPTFRN
jgi:MFS family permease